jgi:hypothetical protein
MGFARNFPVMGSSALEQDGFRAGRTTNAPAAALAARVAAQIPAMTWDDLAEAFDTGSPATWQLLAERGQLEITVHLPVGVVQGDPLAAVLFITVNNWGFPRDVDVD